MEQFNLDIWLQDKSRKVVTRDGSPARIVCWDNTERSPIIAVGKGGNPWSTNENGCYKLNGEESNFDLFFADEKEELTEFEKALLAAFNCVAGKAVTTIGLASFQEDVDEWSEPLLDLARKKLEKENSEFKPKFTYNEKDYSKLANKLIEFRNNTPLCSISYRDGEGRKVILHYEKEILDLIEKEILKDLPKWKKANKETDFEESVLIYEDDYICNDDHVYIDDYYSERNELKNYQKKNKP